MAAFGLCLEFRCNYQDFHKQFLHLDHRWRGGAPAAARLEPGGFAAVNEADMTHSQGFRRLPYLKLLFHEAIFESIMVPSGKIGLNDPAWCGVTKMKHSDASWPAPAAQRCAAGLSSAQAPEGTVFPSGVEAMAAMGQINPLKPSSGLW